MSGCCSGFCTSVPRQFDAKVAAGDLKRYLRKGPNPTTRLLRDGVLRAGGGQSLLDIGAGIGALSFELLGAGFGRSIAVDAAPAYVATARAEAGARGLGERLTVLEADFTRLAEPKASAWPWSAFQTPRAASGHHAWLPHGPLVGACMRPSSHSSGIS